MDTSNAHSPLPYPQAKDGWRISVENLKDTKYILKGRVIKKIDFPDTKEAAPADHLLLKSENLKELKQEYYLIEVDQVLKGEPSIKRIKAFIPSLHYDEIVNEQAAFYIFEDRDGFMGLIENNPSNYISTKHKKYVENGLFNFQTTPTDQLPPLYSEPSASRDDFFLEKTSFEKAYQNLEYETVYETEETQLLKHNLTIVKSRYKSNNRTKIRIFLHLKNGEIELIKSTIASNLSPIGEKVPNADILFVNDKDIIIFYVNGAPLTTFNGAFTITKDDLKPKSGPNIK